MAEFSINFSFFSLVSFKNWLDPVDPIFIRHGEKEKTRVQYGRVVKETARSSKGYISRPVETE